jgi:hypothetical protein
MHGLPVGALKIAIHGHFLRNGITIFRNKTKQKNQK